MYPCLIWETEKNYEDKYNNCRAICNRMIMYLIMKELYNEFKKFNRKERRKEVNRHILNNLHTATISSTQSMQETSTTSSD